jgi:hypothetical protein
MQIDADSKFPITLDDPDSVSLLAAAAAAAAGGTKGSLCHDSSIGL